MAFRFGDFVLDPRTGSLTGPDGPVALRRQTFRLLEVLLEHAPELLDRDTLLDEAWGRTALSPNVVPQAISELRQALGDQAAAPRYIETLHRRGYRMACPVARIEPESAATTGDRREQTDPEAGSRRTVRPLFLVALAAAFAAAFLLSTNPFRDQGPDRDWRWLHAEAMPEILHLAQTDRAAAFRLAHAARQRVPEDPQLDQAWLDLTLPISLTTVPEGAALSIRGYLDGAGDWVEIGKSPLEDVRLPLAQLRIRASLDGHLPVEVAPSVLPVAEPIHLHSPEQTPEGMVFVPAGPVTYLRTPVRLPDFWIDRFEVSNRQYRDFVEAGGYRDPRYWLHPADADGHRLSWEQLMARFVDATDMPGPSTWALGTYPDGEDDHPVEGVSWFEAMAYAEWAGKQLPSAFHWWRAAGLGTPQLANFSDILAASNFTGQGTLPVGLMGGLGPFGTYDMAGNVREWCTTAAGPLRHTLGGAWTDNPYQFRDFDARDPLDRRPGYGFRLVLQEDSLPEPLPGEVINTLIEPDPTVDDATFALYTRLFDYDPEPLDAILEEVDDSHRDWRRERVSFAAGYPGQRVLVQVFLPRNATPPLAAVVHFPGGDALMLEDSRLAGLSHVEPYLRSGRAVVYPVVQGTFERRLPPPDGPLAVRNVLIQQVKDVRRTMDYLESRDDIDPARIAFQGLSYGGVRAPFVLAVENRFRAAIIVSAGVSVGRRLPPEIQMPDYLSRIRMPVLLINGQHDFNFPLEESQRPFFELLGTPEDNKRWVTLDWGHIPPNSPEVAREVLAWADTWLGPVANGPD